MKIKRFMNFILAAAAILSLTACDEKEPDTPPVIEPGTETPGTETPGTETPGTEDPGQTEEPKDPIFSNGELVVDAVLAQINAAKTITINVDDEQFIHDSNYYEDYDDPTEIIHREYTTKTIRDTSIVISKTEDSYVLKITATEEYTDEEGDDVYTENAEHVAYLIDGYYYVYNEYDEVYEVKDLIIPEDIDTYIEELLNEFTITDEEEDELLGYFADLVDKNLNISTNTITLTNDFLPVYTSLGEFIKEIDVNTDSCEDVINNVLALIDEELKLFDIIDQLAITADMTIEQLMNEIDAYLTENYQTTIQATYDSFFVNEEYVNIVEMILAENGYSDAEITEMINQYKTLKFTDLIADFKDITVYCLVSTMLANSQGDAQEESTEVEIPTLEELVAALKEYLQLPLVESEFYYIYTEFNSAISYLKFNEFKMINEITFNDSNEIEKISSSSKIDYVENAPSEIEGYTDLFEAYRNMTFEIVLSENPTVIELPEDIIIINDPNSNIKLPLELDNLEYINYYEYPYNVCGINFEDFTDDDKYDCYISCEATYDDTYYIDYLWLELKEISEDKDTYTFNILEYGYGMNGEYLGWYAGTNVDATLSSTTIVLDFDRETLTFTVSTPTFNME